MSPSLSAEVRGRCGGGKLDRQALGCLHVVSSWECHFAGALAEGAGVCVQASRSLSDSLALGRSMESLAPTDSSVARSHAERNAQLLGFLQKNHLLEASQAIAAMPAVGSATLSAAMGLRAASTQSSMDVMTADHIAAALPELTQPLHDPAGRRASPLAPGSSVPSGKPPAFPQVCKRMSAPSMT